MEITALECSNRSCGNRVFLKDDESVDWLTVQLSSPGGNFRATAHFCPPCARQMTDDMELGPERLDSGQQKVINPGYVDPTLQSVMRQHDDLNRADADRAGIGGAWQPAPPARRSGGGVEAVIPVEVQDPTQPTETVSTESVHMRSAVPVPTDTSWPGWPSGNPQPSEGGRKKKKQNVRGNGARGALRQAIAGAATPVLALLLTVGLMG